MQDIMVPASYLSGSDRLKLRMLKVKSQWRLLGLGSYLEYLRMRYPKLVESLGEARVNRIISLQGSDEDLVKALEDILESYQ